MQKLSMLFCNLPKSKGGINYLDLKEFARAHSIEFPENIKKRALCKLINEKVQQSSRMTTSGPTGSGPVPASSSTKKKVLKEKIPQLTSLYKLTRRLGEGTFGQVWQATELETGHVHALKLLKEVDDTTDREVTTLIEMSKANNNTCSKNVLCYIRQFSAVHQLNDDKKERVYEVIVTDMIKGKSMDKWYQEWYQTHSKPPSVTTMRKIARGLFQGLQIAHEHNIYHLDIKPQNIMIDDDNNTVIIDFGISCTDSAVNLRKNDANNCNDVHGWGTETFMSPEYLSNCRVSEDNEACNAETLAKTDIWAAGLSLLCLLDNFSAITAIDIQFADKKKFINWLKKRSWLQDPIDAADKKLGDAINAALDPQQSNRPTPKEFLEMIK